MSSFIDTVQFSVGRANAYVRALSSNDRYLFVSDHRPSPNTAIPEATQASSNAYYEPWQQMLYGKRVQYSSLGIQNYPYEYGFSYSAWDDQVDMTGLQWYAVVNAGSFYHVFGCLDNANGAPSTVQPDFTTASAADYLWYRASDGYKWVYLATTPSSTVANLATSSLFPLTVNSQVTAAAVPGSIDEVAVLAPGSGYSNYLDGTFQASDVKYGGVPTLYQLSNSSISGANGFYSGCVMLITSGTGVGQYAQVAQFYVTANGNFANLASPLSITPTNGSGWELMPAVSVQSDGTQTVPVVARAVINAAAANSVWRVDVFQRGAGFLGPVTSSVVANSVVGVSNPASVRAVLPPQGGHGYDAASELQATTVLVGCSLTNNESGLVPATNQFRAVGILRDPLFSNVQLTLANSSIPFQVGETVDFLTLAWASNSVSTNSSSVAVSCDTRVFSANSLALFTAGGDQFLGTVASVTNSSSMNLTSNAAFTATGGTCYLANLATSGTVTTAPSASNVFVSGASQSLAVGLTAYGTSSGAAGVVSALTRNGVSKDESTFVQLTLVQYSALGGNFVQNEAVFQGSAQALVQSSNGTALYLSNLTAPFVVGGNNVVGNTSGAVARVTAVWGPELVRGSGEVEYLENLPTVQPGPNTTESFVVAFQF